MHTRSSLKRENPCVVWNTFYYYNEMQQEELVFLQTLFSQNNQLSKQSIFTKSYLTFFYKAWYVGLLTWIYETRSSHCNRRKKNAIRYKETLWQIQTFICKNQNISEMSLIFLRYNSGINTLFTTDTIVCLFPGMQLGSRAVHFWIRIANVWLQTQSSYSLSLISSCSPNSAPNFTKNMAEI